MSYKNAVLDDYNLQKRLTEINPQFGDLITRVAGEVWGLPLIDQKTKACPRTNGFATRGDSRRN